MNIAQIENIRRAFKIGVETEYMRTLAPRGWELWNYVPGSAPTFRTIRGKKDQYGNRTHAYMEISRESSKVERF